MNGGAVVFIAVVTLAASVGLGEPAAAQDSTDGLRVVADTIYRVKPAEGAVDVEVRYSVTNQIQDRRDGNQILQTFFRSIVEFVPVQAIDIGATRSNGTALTMTAMAEPDEADAAALGFRPWEVDLGPNLFFGQTRELTVSFRLPDGPARSLDSWARVNGAIASFPTVARGDPGLSSVRVEFPLLFDIETFGTPIEAGTGLEQWAYTASEIENPLDWFVLFVGFSEQGLTRRPVDIDGVDAELRIAAWPGDLEWESFVETGVAASLPRLEEVIGVPWPIEGELEIVETIAPELAGYAGWFYEPAGSDGADAAIEVGEGLQLDILVHELSHAWFNDEFTRMRWLGEGLAEYFAIQLTDELDPSGAEEFSEVVSTDDNAIDLLDWRDPVFGQDIDPTEAYGYAASYQVISAIGAEIGEEALAAAVSLLWDGANPYREFLADPGPALVDWKDALDAFEIIGGSVSAEDLFVEWVLGDTDEGQLPRRREARDAARALTEREPGWSTPDVIPQLLAGWKFGDAVAMIEEMNGLLDQAESLIDDAARRNLALPHTPQDEYESVENEDHGLEETRAALVAQRSAVDRVLDAYDRAAEPVGLLASIGLYGTDVDAVVAEAHAAFEAGEYALAISTADEVDAVLDNAELLGTRRLVITAAVVLGAALLLVAGIWLLRRRWPSAKSVGERPKGPSALDGIPEAP